MVKKSRYQRNLTPACIKIELSENTIGRLQIILDAHFQQLGPFGRDYHNMAARRHKIILTIEQQMFEPDSVGPVVCM